jgi:hypothetical protein
MHCKGVRQEDPLSPLLFILVMGPLHKLIKKAQQLGMLSSLSKNTNEFRISLYADDAALFIAHLEHDFFLITEIMKIFAMASGLQINVAKTKIFLLNYEATNLSHITSSSIIISNFPCKYLGLPLHFKKSSKQMM